MQPFWHVTFAMEPSTIFVPILREAHVHTRCNTQHWTLPLWAQLVATNVRRVATSLCSAVLSGSRCDDDIMSGINANSGMRFLIYRDFSRDSSSTMLFIGFLAGFSEVSITSADKSLASVISATGALEERMAFSTVSCVCAQADSEHTRLCGCPNACFGGPSALLCLCV